MLAFSILFVFASCKDKENVDENESTTNGHINEIGIPITTEEVEPEEVEDFEAKENTNSQIGLIVDSWLKVISLGERDGKLCAFVRNISDIDVQYAVLSVVCDGETLMFPLTTLTAGSNAVLNCDANVSFSENAQYHSWKITDKMLFEEELSLHADIFEITGEDGFITVKNISDKHIEGTIFVYFKDVKDGIFVDGITYRIRINGLEKDAEIKVQSNNYKKDISKVLFVTYVQ